MKYEVRILSSCIDYVIETDIFKRALKKLNEFETLRFKNWNQPQVISFLFIQITIFIILSDKFEIILINKIYTCKYICIGCPD